MKRILQWIAIRFGYRILRNDRMRYYNLNIEGDEISKLISYYSGVSSRELKLIDNYNGEFCQDVFVNLAFRFKESGTFIEFGATDGLGGSNTLILERDLHWNGVLIEPIASYYSDLKLNRSKSVCLNKVVSSVDDKMIGFKERNVRSFSRVDVKNPDYLVETIRLDTIIKKYFSVDRIDFLSIDVEGHELTILDSFDWAGTVKFNVICIEHNFEQRKRDRINSVLESSGYIRVFSELSNVDDWYFAVDFVRESGFAGYLGSIQGE